VFETVTPQAPPFCPNPHCHFHRGERARWRWVRDGFFSRCCPPRRVQRYRCLQCRRRFSEFRTSYWLKRPELLQPLFWRPGFTDSELRRSGRMTLRQRRRRAVLEARHGRPHPRAVERNVAELLRLVAPRPQTLALHTDDHTDYPRALRHLRHLAVSHHTVSSRAARTARNPLFAINLLDLLIRHSGANHKRETLAFSKRRQSAAERLAVFLVWRNYLKPFSERARDGTPAMRLGLCARPLTVRQLLAQRLFPSRVRLPERWARYYWRQIATRRLAHCATHRLKYAG